MPTTSPQILTNLTNKSLIELFLRNTLLTNKNPIFDIFKLPTPNEAKDIVSHPLPTDIFEIPAPDGAKDMVSYPLPTNDKDIRPPITITIDIPKPKFGTKNGWYYNSTSSNSQAHFFENKRSKCGLSLSTRSTPTASPRHLCQICIETIEKEEGEVVI